MKPLVNAFRMMHLAEKEPLFRDKYLPNGLKPIEAFYSDISNNLVKWATHENTIYYETNDYWYSMTVERPEHEPEGVIIMRRFNIETNEELCDFANRHSIEDLGKKWLINLTDKRVPAV